MIFKGKKHRYCSGIWHYFFKLWLYNFFARVPVNIEKCLWIFDDENQILPVNLSVCPWTFSKNRAREPWKLPVNISQKLPVNALTYPWIFRKKCPWTQKSTREHWEKIDVHGHFWGSREKKNTASNSSSDSLISSL